MMKEESKNIPWKIVYYSLSESLNVAANKIDSLCCKGDRKRQYFHSGILYNMIILLHL